MFIKLNKDQQAEAPASHLTDASWRVKDRMADIVIYRCDQ